jgi:hypothetical protein
MMGPLPDELPMLEMEPCGDGDDRPKDACDLGRDDSENTTDSTASHQHEGDAVIDLSRTSTAITHYVDECVNTFGKNMVTIGMMLTGQCELTLEAKPKKSRLQVLREEKGQKEGGAQVFMV